MYRIPSARPGPLPETYDYANKLLAISKDNEKPEIYRYLSFLCRKTKEYNKAIEFLNRAIEIFPDDPEIYIELSQLLIDIRQYSQALHIARKLIRLSPDRYEGYYSAGLALILLGRYEEAVQSFETASNENPDYHLCYSQLGKSLLPLGRYQEAEEYFKKALKLFSKNRPALFGLADSYLDTGKYENAISIFKKLNRKLPRNNSQMIIEIGKSRLINRSYLNLKTLPYLSKFFKLAKNKEGDRIAGQIEYFYALLLDQKIPPMLNNCEGEIKYFFSNLKEFLKLDSSVKLSIRRDTYKKIEKSLRKSTKSHPFLYSLFLNWTTIIKYLDENHYILPLIILEYGIKENLQVHNPVKFTVKAINGGILPANDVSIEYQHSENFKLEQYNYHFTTIETSREFQMDMEPLTEGPLQLVAKINMDDNSYLSTLHLNAFQKNPYFYGRPVHFSGMFFGRRELKNTIKARLVNVVKQDILISGIRRIGKTSLLYQLKNELQPPFYPVYFSLQQVGDFTDMVGLLRQLLYQIIVDLNKKNHRFKKMLSPDKITVELKNQSAFDIACRHFLNASELLFSKMVPVEPECRIIILLDEGDYLFKMSAGFQNFFRFLLQKFERLVLVIAGSPHIKELSGSDFSSPFFNIFAQEIIKGLKPADVRELIDKPMEAIDLHVSAAVHDETYKLCGGHPHLLQAICYHMVEAMFGKKGHEVGLNELEEAKLKVIEELKESFNGIWNELNEDEMSLMEMLSKDDMKISDAENLISRESINHLINFELAIQDNGWLKRSSELIACWVIEKMRFTHAS